MVLRREGHQPEECFFDFVFQPMFDRDGRVDAIAAVVFDVTELAKARRDAEVANRAKDESWQCWATSCAIRSRPF